MNSEHNKPDIAIQAFQQIEEIEAGKARVGFIAGVTAVSFALSAVLLYGASEERHLAAQTTAETQSPTIKPATPKKNKPASTPTAIPTVTATNPVVRHTSPKPTSTPSSPESQDSCLDQLSTEQLLAATLFVPVKGDGSYYRSKTMNPEQTLQIFNKYQIGNVVVMGNPTDDPNHNLRNFTDSHKVSAPLLVGIDEEGGTVLRLQDSITNPTTFPSEQQIAKTKTPAEAKVLVEAQYKHLASYGITAVFGPDADLVPASGKPSAIGQSRSFGSDPTKAADYVDSYVSAAAAAGIETFVKHAPGEGSVSLNTDTGDGVLPAAPTLQARDMKVYDLLKGKMTSAMVGTATVAKDASGHSLTNGKPAALDPTIRNWLVNEESVSGDIVTDDIAATGAQTGGLSAAHTAIGLTEAIKEAWLAGEDPLFVQADPTKSLDSILSDALKAGKQLVADGQLSKAALLDMAKRSYETRGINICNITPKP